MVSLVDALNLLKHAIDTELALRQAAITEFNNDNQSGPMKTAHDQSILNVIIAAQNLITLSKKE